MNQDNPEPEAAQVSASLTALRDRVNDDQELIFLDETLLCHSCKAYRAAIVMGWNLAYYHLVRWIFARRKVAFNKVLTTRIKKGTKTHPSIKTLDDFQLHKESFVIDICVDAKLVTKNEAKILRESLDRRNRYAHPSNVVSTAPIAAGHIADLLEHVVTAKKFVWSTKRKVSKKPTKKTTGKVKRRTTQRRPKKKRAKSR